MDADRLFKHFFSHMTSEEKESTESIDTFVNNYMLNNIKIVESGPNKGRLQAGLVWRESHPPLPTNLSLAKKWLINTVSKLQKMNLYQQYDEEIKRQVDENVVDCLGPLKFENSCAGHHFLPHFAVVRENHQTTKLRIVFAANAGRISLYDCLYP